MIDALYLVSWMATILGWIGAVQIFYGMWTYRGRHVISGGYKVASCVALLVVVLILVYWVD